MGDRERKLGDRECKLGERNVNWVSGMYTG